MEHDWFSKLDERRGESLKGISVNDLVARLKPKCRQMVTEDELRSLLKEKKKLRIKLGADPTDLTA